jgi:hypothetical protein
LPTHAGCAFLIGADAKKQNEKAKKMGWMNPPTSFTRILRRGISSGVRQKNLWLEDSLISGEARIVLCKSRAGKPLASAHARIEGCLRPHRRHEWAFSPASGC